MPAASATSSIAARQLGSPSCSARARLKPASPCDGRIGNTCSSKRLASHGNPRPGIGLRLPGGPRPGMGRAQRAHLDGRARGGADALPMARADPGAAQRCDERQVLLEVLRAAKGGAGREGRGKGFGQGRQPRWRSKLPQYILGSNGLVSLVDTIPAAAPAPRPGPPAAAPQAAAPAWRRRAPTWGPMRGI